MARGKTTAIERFAALLKQSSTIPEIKDFREQTRDVFRLGGAEGLECWIEARRELGLLDNPAVAKAASGLQAAIASAINEALGPLPKRPKPRRSWEEQWTARYRSTTFRVTAHRISLVEPESPYSDNSEILST